MRMVFLQFKNVSSHRETVSILMLWNSSCKSGSLMFCIVKFRIHSAVLVRTHQSNTNIHLNVSLLLPLFRHLLRSWKPHHHPHLQPQLLWSQPCLRPSPSPPPPRPPGQLGRSTTTQRRTPSPTSVPPTSSWTCLRSPPGPAPGPSNRSLHQRALPSTLPPSPKSSSSRHRYPPAACQLR